VPGFSVMVISREIIRIIRQALQEDAAKSDITSRLSIPEDLKIKAHIKANASGIICGINVAKAVFRIMDRRVVFTAKLKDGMFVKRGILIASLSGNARSILSAERVALNFLSRLSGIAYTTYQFVQRIKPFGAKILDTRKTTPNLRILEKYAVRVGGGHNHRFNLSEMVLLKENHIKAMSAIRHQYDLKSLVKKIRRSIPRHMKIEIEAQSLSEFKNALEADCDIIMFDNMNVAQIKKAVSLTKGRKVQIEVSGGIDLNNVRKIASLGVDFISTSKLTCGIEYLDVSLDVVTPSR